MYKNLTPTNILMDDNRNIALIDFGMCRLSLKNDEQALQLNAPYLAPEVVTQGYKKESDWWSLGIIMFKQYQF